MADWINITNATTCNWSPSEEDLFNSIQKAVRILVTVVSGLSLICNIGIFSYFYFHEFIDKHAKKGNRGRLIAMSITCISLADFLSCISHIQGVWTTYKVDNQSEGLLPKTRCGAQAILSVFGTLASFLWIDVLVIVAMVDSRAKRCLNVMVSPGVVVMTQAVCWGVPLFTAVGLASANVLGFEEGIDIGWCYIDTTGHGTTDTILIFFFGRQLWAFLTMICLIILPVGSCVYSSYHSVMLGFGENGNNEERQALNQQEPEVGVNFNPCCCSRWIDKKIPIQFEYLSLGIILASGFMFLRLPNIVIDWFITYDDNYRCTPWYLGGLVLAAFGDSSIGLFNCIWILIYKMTCRKREAEHNNEPPAPPAVEQT